MNCGVTKHGSARAYKRGGVPKSKQLNTIKRVLKYGLEVGELEGGLRHYITNKYKQHKENGSYIYKVYGNLIYVFGKGNLLITVLNTPKEYIQQAEMALGEKRRRIEDEELRQAAEAAEAEKSKSKAKRSKEEIKRMRKEAEQRAIAEAEALRAKEEETAGADGESGTKNTILNYSNETALSSRIIPDNKKSILIIGDCDNKQQFVDICNEAVDNNLSTLAIDLSINTLRTRSYVRWNEFIENMKRCLEISDGVLIVNKEGNYLSYATFLTICESWKIDKQIFLLYRPTEGLDYVNELFGMVPVSLDGYYKRIFEC